MKILIDFWLDGYGYEDEEERRKACLEFVEEQLNTTTSGIKILWAEDSCE